MYAIAMLLPMLAPPAGPPPVDAATGEEKTRLEFLLAAVKDNHERLRSGVYRASGRFTEGHATAPLDADLRVFAAFDYDSGRVRFDRVQPVRIIPWGTTESRQELFSISHIRTPDRDVNWQYTTDEGDSRVVSIHEPGSVYPDMGIFDVRTFGLSGWDSLGPTEFSFEHIFDVVRERHAESVSKEADGAYRVTFRTGPLNEIRIVIWFDQRQGYSPIRNQMSLWDIHRDGWDTPVTAMDLSWKSYDDVWVPTSVSARKQYGPANEASEISLAFEWLSVNAPPPDDALFSPHSFEAHPDAMIVDTRVSPPLVVGKVGDPDYRRASQTPVAERDRRAGTVLVAVFAVLLVLGGVFYVYRHRRAERRA